MIYRRLPACDNPAVRARCLHDLRDKNVVISAHVRSAELPVYERLNLSIHCVRNGAEAFALDRRRLLVDDDSYLMLNAGNAYGSRIASTRLPLHSFSVHFRRGLVDEALAVAGAGTGASLDCSRPRDGMPAEFIEQLTPHNAIVSPALRRLIGDIEDGEDDGDWLEEQCAVLLTRILRWHHGLGATLDDWPAARAPLRREIERRIGLATDLMLTDYAKALTLQRIAEEACLSRYHFVRLFRAVHRMTPYAFLQRKRCAVATRLLRTTDLSIEAIAHAVGIANRITLFRLIRKHLHVSPSALRTHVRVPELDRLDGRI